MNNNLFEYLVRIGDDSLIIGQRLSEWCGHGPILEEDIAMTNIALDFIGQTTSLFEYAARVEGKGRDEDQLAFVRLENEYKNVLLVEQPNEDFAVTMMRQFLFDAFRKPFYEALSSSSDAHLAAIAEKSLKETKYHLKHSSEWVIRMGDGTQESHERVQNALNDLWKYTDELFFEDTVDTALQAEGIAPKLAPIKEQWTKTVQAIFAEATLTIPTNGWQQTGGRIGRHTEYMGYILTEMQYMQRTYPNMKW